MSDPSPSLPGTLINQRDLSKLKWRCSRGLLENDLFIARFFERYEASLTVTQGLAMSALMTLSDNDLLDLHMGRKTLAQVGPEILSDEVSEVLKMLRRTH